ncbi:MAG: magnesium and cobalt exporter, family [Acidobacteriota bacterium]|jgi:CBS domain containing-hemolysin-like protein|nr:magnesium and cobalt exporter, family [Acidobacteriota bacterium]
MGSSGSHLHWIVIATLCGILYLVFDAARSFIQQLSPVRLRQWSGEAPIDGRGRWLQYDARNFHLISGALLQFALIIAFSATVMVFDYAALGYAVTAAAAIWITIAMLWKFVIALIPEEIGEGALRLLIPVSHFFYYLFWPLLFPLRMLTQRMDREDPNADDDEEVTDEDVQAYIDVGEEEGILEGGEGQLIQSIVDFGDRIARELMTPRIDVQAFEDHRPLEELARMFSESKYSRIPIYHDSIDSITGIVHIKDLFDAVLKGEQRPVSELARPPYFVSETKKASELLRELQLEHLQVAVVVDEYGGTAGLVTIEDIIEELVGDISDEHEDEEASVVDLGEGNYLVNGLLRVDTLEELLGAKLEGDDYETVAGLIFTTLGRVPKVGAVVTKDGFRFEVDKADRRRIYRVRVSKDPDWRREEEENDE